MGAVIFLKKSKRGLKPRSRVEKRGTPADVRLSRLQLILRHKAKANDRVWLGFLSKSNSNANAHITLFFNIL